MGRWILTGVVRIRTPGLLFVSSIVDPLVIRAEDIISREALG
jgi:hypothetical protein